MLERPQFLLFRLGTTAMRRTEGALLEELGPMPEGFTLLMDRAYEGNETRQLVLDLGMIPVVPPKSNRLHPWDYDHAVYKKRNESEHLFRRLKGFRRIFALRETRRLSLRSSHSHSSSRPCA